MSTSDATSDKNAPNGKKPALSGAQSLVKTLIANDVDICFANPGTSEMHFVAALDTEPKMRCVLGLFEGVVTGAADGYGRMADKPACTLLHLGPGLANGLANLHNARRANTPVVNIVGEHATYHRELDAPLTSDIEGFARPVSGWIKTSMTATDVAADGAAAVTASRQPPGQVATLILPADTAWNEAEAVVPAAPIPTRAPHSGDVDAIAKLLLSDAKCAFLVNGQVVRAAGLDMLGRLQTATGAALFGDTFISRTERGAGRVNLPRLPYFAEQAQEALAPFEHLILVETKAPVSFFAYPGVPSEIAPDTCTCHVLCLPHEDGIGALAALVDAVGAAKADNQAAGLVLPGEPTGELTPASIAQTVAHLMPENAIVVNEAATSGFAIPGLTYQAAPHDWLELTGGAIGMGIPASTGAALACPDRRVLSLQADGSGMYTVQGLWTQARENLDITTVIFANRKYAILQVEFMRVGAHNPGRKAMDMLQLDRPDLDWVALATGMGVPAIRVTDAESFNRALARSFATPGPYVIEACLG